MTTTVLVCTRNRAPDVARLLRSLLASSVREECLQIIIVDQSDNPETRETVNGLDHSARVELVRCETPGKGRALNVGLARARGEIVVCTDDDCEAPPGWPGRMAGELRRRPGVAVLYCQVIAAPSHDSRDGYIPTFLLSESRLYRTLSEVRRFGLGAGMAVRTEAIRAIGGFDEALGPGGLFPSGDDWDVGMRALLGGWHVYEAADLVVVHHGFRSFVDGTRHVRRDWLASGAVCAKALRSGSWAAIRFWLRIFVSLGLQPLLVNLLTLRLRRTGFGKVSAFLRGVTQGMGVSVDPATLCYKPAQKLR